MVRRQLPSVAEEVSRKLGYYTYEAVASALGLSEETVRHYAEHGRFARVYIGIQPLITEKSIKEFQQTARRQRPASQRKRRGS